MPLSKISLCLVDGRIGNELEEGLRSRGIRLIKTRKMSELYDAVSYHPDIMIHHIGGRDIIAAPNTDIRLVYELQDEGFNIISGKKVIEKKYPSNIAYNAARFGDYAICSTKHTDVVLLDNLINRGVTLIDTKQGYSKCSTCVVGEGALITSDRGILNSLEGYDIDCLQIDPGYISLFELSYGFIGGATGYISKDELAFYGNIKFHPQESEIKNFLLKHGKKLINLSENLLVDLGTLIPLKEYSILM